MQRAHVTEVPRHGDHRPLGWGCHRATLAQDTEPLSYLATKVPAKVSLTPLRTARVSCLPPFDQAGGSFVLARFGPDSGLRSHRSTTDSPD